MASSADIYSAIPRPRSALEYAQGYQELEGNALMLREKQRQADEANALMQFNRTVAANTPADQLADTYHRAGYIKQAGDARAAQLEGDKMRAATEGSRAEAQRKARDHLLAGVGAYSSREAVKQHIADGVVNGSLDMGTAKRLMDAVPDDVADPAGFARFRDTLAAGRDKVMADETQRRGQDVQLSQQGVSADLADDRMAWEREKFDREEALKRDELERKKDSGDSPKGSDVQIVEGPDGFVAVNKTTGQGTPVQIGGTQVMGKRAEKQAQRARDSQDMQKLVGDAEKLLGQATGSGLGAMVDATAGFFGASTAGAEANDALKVIQAQMIAKTDRLEGPQSDADRALYQQAVASIGDPNVPVERRRAALATVKDIQKRYFRGPPEAVSGGGGSVLDEADAILRGGK